MILAIMVPALAQSPERKLFESAAEALGGRVAVMGVNTLVIYASGRAWSQGQNPEPEGPNPFSHLHEFRRAIDLQNGRMRVDTHRVTSYRFALPTDTKASVFLDGDIAFNIGGGFGPPAQGPVRQGDAAARDRRIDMLGNPITIVRAGLDAASRLSSARKQGNADVVDLTTAKGDVVTVAFDARTHLPASVSWMTSSDNLGDVRNTVAFQNYETVDGLKMPRQYLTRIDFRSWPVQELNVTTNNINADVTALRLEAPADVRAATSAAPAPVRVDVEQAGKGVWRLGGTGGAASILIEFDDHTTLYEAPSSEARTKAVIDRARALVPGKPLTEVIASHHHFDHTGGIRAAVAEGLTVLSYRSGEQFFREVTSRKATLRPDLLARSGKTLKFRSVDETLTIKDNTNELILYHVEGVDHAPTLIVGWLPAQKLFVQADLIDIGWVQHPWGDVYAAFLKKHNIVFDKDVPVHGRIATWAEELAAMERTRSPLGR
jgi:glyoxylase-like metal-dependent hydrolase (beta-lactamase superfamily II)